MAKKKRISPDVYAFMRELVQESLHKWFKEEDWVRIASDGSIADACGTSKNKKNPDRCLPRKKAQSMSKAERAATARKKKKAGAKGKQVVPNTKKGKVTKGYTKEDLRNYVTGVLAENAKLAAFWTKMDSGTKRKLFPKLFNRRFNQLTDSQISQIVFTLKKNKLIQEKKKKKKKKKKKDDRCTRLAKQKYDTWPSAYASGAVVRCRRGEIWKNKK